MHANQQAYFAKDAPTELVEERIRLPTQNAQMKKSSSFVLSSAICSSQGERERAGFICLHFCVVLLSSLHGLAAYLTIGFHIMFAALLLLERRSSKR